MKEMFADGKTPGSLVIARDGFEVRIEGSPTITDPELPKTTPTTPQSPYERNTEGIKEAYNSILGRKPQQEAVNYGINVINSNPNGTKNDFLDAFKISAQSELDQPEPEQTPYERNTEGINKAFAIVYPGESLDRNRFAMFQRKIDAHPNGTYEDFLADLQRVANQFKNPDPEPIPDPEPTPEPVKRSLPSYKVKGVTDAYDRYYPNRNLSRSAISYGQNKLVDNPHWTQDEFTKILREKIDKILDRNKAAKDKARAKDKAAEDIIEPELDTTIQDDGLTDRQRDAMNHPVGSTPDKYGRYKLPGGGTQNRPATKEQLLKFYQNKNKYK